MGLLTALLIAPSALAIPFLYELTEENQLVVNSHPNTPSCVNDALGMLSCKTCFTTPGVACTVVGLNGCQDGEGYKADNLLTFTHSGKQLNGRITVIGGEGVVCRMNGQDFMSFYARNTCGSLQSFDIPGNVFRQGNNTLTCLVAGGGSDEDNGFKLSAFSYGVNEVQLTGSMQVLPEAEKPLGTVGEKLPVSEYRGTPGWLARVQSRTPEVMIWFNQSDTYTQRTTDDPDSEIWACADTNTNNICDGTEATAVSCMNNNGDWYRGMCCGTNFTSCGYVGTPRRLQTIYVRKIGNEITQVRPTTFSGAVPIMVEALYKRTTWEQSITVRDTPANGFTRVSAPTVYVRQNNLYIIDLTATPPTAGQASYYITVPLYIDDQIDAICGKSDEDTWKWAPKASIGEVHELFGCPNGSVLSDGTDFFSCGGQLENVTQEFGDFRSATFAGVTHEYYCKDKQVTECAGKTGGFSAPELVMPMGSQLPIDDKTFYCASDGDWTTDLDVKDYDSCTAAGLFWTGGKCCSEANDFLEYYNDPAYPNGTGGCWNQQYIESGDFAAQGKVINHKGQFVGCKVTEDDILSIKDTYTDEWLVNNSVLQCGAVLRDARSGGMPHAFCDTDGVWKFTDTPGGTINKSIAWSLYINMTGVRATGCCAFDQCWNGTQCQDAGAFYRVGDAGFTCKLPQSLPESGCTTTPSGTVVCCSVDASGNRVCIA